MEYFESLHELLPYNPQTKKKLKPYMKAAVEFFKKLHDGLLTKKQLSNLKSAVTFGFLKSFSDSEIDDMVSLDVDFFKRLGEAAKKVKKS